MRLTEAVRLRLELVALLLLLMLLVVLLVLSLIRYIYFSRMKRLESRQRGQFVVVAESVHLKPAFARLRPASEASFHSERAIVVASVQPGPETVRSGF